VAAVQAAAEGVAQGVEAAASILPHKLNLNPLDQLIPTVIIAVMLIIIATYFALRWVYVLPYLAVLEEREQIFGVADARRAEAAQCVAAANVGAENAVAEAVAEAEAMRAEARERADEYRRTRVSEATSAAAARLESGRAQIAAARAAELSRLRSEAAQCIHVACGKLVGTVDDELVEATVERLMTRQAN
jgi:F-type H+-transporting ATPase subunit b